MEKWIVETVVATQERGHRRKIYATARAQYSTSYSFRMKILSVPLFLRLIFPL